MKFYSYLSSSDFLSNVAEETVKAMIRLGVVQGQIRVSLGVHIWCKNVSISMEKFISISFLILMAGMKHRE